MANKKKVVKWFGFWVVGEYACHKQESNPGLKTPNPKQQPRLEPPELKNFQSVADANFILERDITQSNHHTSTSYQ